jgi:hypothetical protein
MANCLKRLPTFLTSPRKLIYQIFTLVNALDLILLGRQIEFTVGSKIYRQTYFSRSVLCTLLQRIGFKVTDIRSSKWGPLSLSYDVWMERQ